MSNLEKLYEQDFSAWIERNTGLLRQGRFAEVDVDHLVEELSDMGKSQQHELVNRLRVLLAHLLKWQFQHRQLAGRWAEFEGKSWRNTIIEQRAALRYLIEKNPGLKSRIAAALEEAYSQALDVVVDETGLPARLFPTENPYDEQKVFDRSYFPPTEP
jgi:hypothetical protein